jgi:hypothetical protein
MEARVAGTRTGHGGTQRLATCGLIAAAFDHWDTRAGDPNLHTHLVIANKIQGPDGQWRSLDARILHKAAVAPRASRRRAERLRLDRATPEEPANAQSYLHWSERWRWDLNSYNPVQTRLRRSGAVDVSAGQRHFVSADVRRLLRAFAGSCDHFCDQHGIDRRVAGHRSTSCSPHQLAAQARSRAGVTRSVQPGSV